MARCISCNEVFSEFYLKNGVCENCLEKHSTIESNLSDLEKKEMKKLSKKISDINIYKFLELKNIVDMLKQKHNVEISKDNYLTIETLLVPYLEILFKKRNELVTLDDYGNEKFEALNDEIKYFIENTFSKLLKENNIEIGLDFIHNFIFEKVNVEGKVYNKELLKKEEEIKNTGFIYTWIFLIVSFLIIMAIVKSCSKSTSISDKEYYEMKYQQEKKETLRDIQKAVDEYKYQQYKQNK
ncbi:hypothetical protein [Aliarcobacter butzleri]|uniref:hypothetical protein n=1 Tax=Aliarcobacter butzleri TaxID=28197 RepID=UPI0021B26F49|nr:hypothetical protein [Aliarcobacter butzleri]MCT7586967.1 hypothetical protein [Aliarcobacter butzleri]